MVQDSNLEYEVKQRDVYQLISNNDIYGIRSYLRKNRVRTLDELLYLKLNDLLIYSIDHNCNPEMVQFIIENCKYKNLNFTTTAPVYGTTTPLLAAFCNGDLKSLDMDVYFKGNFEIANILLKHGANINYKINSVNILSFLNSQQVLNKNQLKFILENGFDVKNIDSYLINNLSNEFVDIIFEFYVFNNDFIINLLNIYKDKKAFTTQQFAKIIEKERSKIEIKNNWYMEAIRKEKYSKIETLLKHEKKDSDSNFLKLVSLLESYDKKNHTARKQKLLDKIKKKSINIKVNPKILNELAIEDIDGKRKKIKKLIKRNIKSDLETYVVDNKLPMRELNSETFDLVIFAIENNASLEIIQYLTKLAQYNNFNFCIYEGNDFKTPFTSTICHKRFEVADYIIKNGANVNYHLMKYYNNNYNNDIINYLFKHDCLDKDTFKYISSCSNLKNMAVDSSLITKLIDSSKNEITKHIIEYTSLPIQDDWYKHAMLTANPELLDILYELDERGEPLKNNKLGNIYINLHNQDLMVYLMNNVKNENLKSELKMLFFSLLLIAESRVG